jgi:hypothetical protein
LEQAHEARRAEAAKNLNALETVKNRALARLAETGDLFRHLTGKQRELINSRMDGGSPPLEELRRRAAVPCAASMEAVVPALLPALEQVDAPLFRSVPALRRMTVLRKNMVQFGVICDRAGELTGALSKSLVVFDYQYKSACRTIFPLGFLSRLWRNIRKLLRCGYFSWRDMNPLRNLGMAAGFILKMAEAPLL